MYSIYQDALLAPKDVAICGIEIGQLTIAQSACLWAMENPFVFSAKGSLAQFCTVLVVLQKSYPFSDIDNWVTEALALRKKLVEKPRGILKYFKKNKVYSIDDIDIEIQSLVNYFKYHNKAHPRAFPADQPNKTPTIPWQWSVVFSLRRYFKEDDIKAWNYPLLKAMAYHAAICHSLGDDTLYNEMDCNIREEGEKEEELKEEEKSNGG